MNPKKPRRLCLNCKKECKRPGCIYCSNKCQKELERLNLIQSGKADIRTIRRYLIKISGNKCKICGLTEWNDQLIPLVTDHKDGNSDNNKIENMRLVCCNCDALLPTYKGRNKGNGRHNRRIRYSQGKSY
jgi:hypothetical protein